MNEVDIKFEKEEVEGAVAVGTYLIDAAKRVGVDIGCDRLGLTDACAMMIKEGADLLTEPTKAEHEVLGEERLKGGERLGCQTKLNAPGSMLVKTTEPEIPEVTIEEQFEKKFAELPLEEKAAQLLRLETMAFGETFNFILNSPYKIVGKVMDVMAGFGLTMDKDSKDAVKPVEHAEKNGSENGAAAEPKPDGTPLVDEDDAIPNADEVVEADYEIGENDDSEARAEDNISENEVENSTIENKDEN